jgi:hypothetical protein
MLEAIFEHARSVAVHFKFAVFVELLKMLGKLLKPGALLDLVGVHSIF